MTILVSFRQEDLPVEKKQEMPQIGIIFHWGLYSVPAYDDIVSARRRRLQNGSEWYLARLRETGNFRPLSGWDSTQKYHKEHYQDQDYFKFQEDFGHNINFDDWMRLCREVGASYVILTAKHHDGFCLWNTSTNSPKSTVDYLQMFKISASKFGLRFGIYYSWSEFIPTCTIKYISEIVDKQMAELEKYEPDIFWFDGHWKCQSQFSKNKIHEICLRLHKNNPYIEINDRIPRMDKGYDDPTFLGLSTYRVYADRFLPAEQPTVPWEHINTIGLSWGRNNQQQQSDYKTGKDLYDLYIKVSRLNGRFLLNLAPDAYGKIDPNEETSLKAFGDLLLDS